MTEQERRFFRDEYGIEYVAVANTDDGRYEVGYYVPTTGDLKKLIYYKFKNGPVAQSE